MNYRKFDRHEVLNTMELMQAHSTLISDVTDYQMENGISDFDFINELYGIYDGYLYSSILMRAMEYPSDIYERVLDTYRLIDEFIESKLMETEEYRNQI
jgi:hypothetical protein